MSVKSIKGYRRTHSNIWIRNGEIIPWVWFEVTGLNYQEAWEPAS
jgi:hypothetical protein